MRWPGVARGWWPYYLPRTKFDYAGEVGDGSQSNMVVACINWMARTCPEAPLIVVDEKPDGTRETVFDHELPKLVERPNPAYSGVLMWQATIADWMLGNAYWLKVRSRRGGVVELWWAPSWTMEPKWPDDGMTFVSHYEYRPDRGREAVRVEPGDVVHFRYGLDPENPRKGLSPLKTLMRELFTDEEASNMTAALMRNLGVPGVILSPESVGSTANREEAEETKERFMEKFGGDKRGEPMVMTAPTKVEVLSFSPEQMLLRDLRRIPEERATAVLGLPAMVVGLGAGLDRTTFTNYKEARTAAWDQAVIPAHRLWAADLEIQLLPDFDTNPRRDVDFDLSRVRALQPDMNEVFQRANTAVAGGWGMVSDARRAVGWPVRPEHDVYLRQITVTEIPAAKSRKALPPGGTKGRKESVAARRELARRHEGIFEQVASRLVAREREAIMKIAGDSLKARADFESAVDTFYHNYDELVAEEARPAFLAYAESIQAAAAAEVGADAGMTPALETFVGAYAGSFGARWAGSSRGQVRSVAGDALSAGEDAVGALGARFDEWSEKRPGKTALWETRRAGNAVALQTYETAGLDAIWVTVGDSCPYCTSLDGQTVGRGRVLIEAGQDFQPEGAERPLVSDVSIGHAPAHDGCDCSVMPA